MYKDFKKCLKGKLHIIIICVRSRKIRQLWKKKSCQVWKWCIFSEQLYSYKVEKIYSDLYDGGTNFAQHQTNLCRIL